MITLHGEEVKFGDKVWDILYGWGVVSTIRHREGEELPLQIEYLDAELRFAWIKASLMEKRLYWQPIVFEIPKKPIPKKPTEKAWQWVCREGGRYRLTFYHYASKEDVRKSDPIAEPIEPYLPSEIEREVENDYITW